MSRFPYVNLEMHILPVGIAWLMIFCRLPVAMEMRTTLYTVVVTNV